MQRNQRRTNGRKISSRGGGQELVTLDSRRHAAAPVVRFDTQYTRIAANVNVTGKRDLLRKSEDKFDRAAGIGSCGLDQKIQAAEADVTGFPILFRNAIAGSESYFQGEHHRETSRGAPSQNVVQRPPRRFSHLSQN